jgi:hypothetical protein
MLFGCVPVLDYLPGDPPEIVGGNAIGLVLFHW